MVRVSRKGAEAQRRDQYLPKDTNNVKNAKIQPFNISYFVPLVFLVREESFSMRLSAIARNNSPQKKAERARGPVLPFD
jgi:hypothetical protein